MNVNGKPTPSIWPLSESPPAVGIIDQTALPHAYRTRRLQSLAEVAEAIRSMQVRGAPLIGASAAYGVALALAAGKADDAALAAACATLAATRPTAVNLRWALERMTQRLTPLAEAERPTAAWREAQAIAAEDVAQNHAIGEHGLCLLAPLLAARRRLNLMTHCNAGWLATVDHGTALAPVYAAFDAGHAVHVWVSETRPRNQGLLTAWELAEHGVPHTLIADNAAGILLQSGQVDAVIVGADRIAANGDVANKVGTYLKALAAREAGVPFYVAAPHSTFDAATPDGASIVIEERSADEVRFVHGRNKAGSAAALRQLPANAAVANPAFDVTPARLISAFISQSGCFAADALPDLS